MIPSTTLAAAAVAPARGVCGRSFRCRGAISSGRARLAGAKRTVYRGRRRRGI